MSDAYSDDRTPVRSPADPLVPAAITRAAGAAVFLALVLGMAVWAYRLGTRDATEVPVIRAMEGPARLQPEDPGGLQAAHQGLAVNDVLAAGPESAPEPAEAPAVLPPPVALAEEDGPQGELVLAVPDFPAVEPGEGEDLRLPVPDEGPAADAGATGAPPTDIASLVPALLAEAMAEADADAGEAGETTAPTRPLGRPSGLVVRAEAPRPAATTPAPAPAPVQAPAVAEAPGAARPAPGATEVSAVAPGARLVQLGAFDNEALARQVWSQLVARNGDLLGGKSLYLERATHNARVFYRLRVAGFGSTDETRVLCESLRGRGVDCIPVILN
jgi:cell division septation protein DedD